MAQTQKSPQKGSTKNQEERNKTQLQENEQTQTPPSRQAGSNQPQRQDYYGGQQGELMRRGGQDRMSRRGQQFAPLSPFSFMRRFSEEMDRLFEDFGFGGGMLERGFGTGSETSIWSPQTEIFERGDQLVIRADLPGMTKDDIQVDIEDEQIIIRGERRDERESNEEGVYLTERSYGNFYRSFPLPQGIDPEQASANFYNGVLEVSMPKPERKERGRRLEIGESEQQSNRQISGGKSKSANQ